MTNDSQVCDFKLPAGSSLQSTTQSSTCHSHSHDQDAGHSHSHSTPLSAAAQEHGHTHEIMDHPGKFTERDMPNHEGRDWKERAFTVGIGG